MLLRLGTIMRRTPAGIALTALFVVLLFSSLFYVSHAMDGAGSMLDCPFATGSKALCSMGVDEHLTSWESLSLATPLLLLILVLVPFIRGVSTLAHALFRQLHALCALHTLTLPQVLNRTRRGPDQLTELFSQGILHPKLF